MEKLEIELSKENINRYGEYIIDECGKKNVKIVNNEEVYIKGKKVIIWVNIKYFFLILGLIPLCFLHL